MATKLYRQALRYRHGPEVQDPDMAPTLTGHGYDCPCCNGPTFVVNALEAQDPDMQEPVTPRGITNELPPPLPPFSLTDDQIKQVIAFFEGLLSPEELKNFEGILRALPKGESLDRSDPLYEDYSDQWEWDHELHRYVRVEGNKVLSPEELKELSNHLLDNVVGIMAGSTIALVIGNASIQKWVMDMRRNMQLSLAMQYMLGRGGLNTLVDTDMYRINGLVDTQNVYLDNFSQELTDGQVSGSQAVNRAKMYGEGGTEAFEKGKAADRHLDLPEYPADGSQICRKNCRCYWHIEEDKDNVAIAAYWKLDKKARHCESCTKNARIFNPYLLHPASYREHIEDELKQWEEGTLPERNPEVIRKNLQRDLRKPQSDRRREIREEEEREDRREREYKERRQYDDIRRLQEVRQESEEREEREERERKRKEEEKRERDIWKRTRKHIREMKELIRKELAEEKRRHHIK